MTRKQLPLILMLIAGAVTSITVYFRGLGLKTMLLALLAAFVAFYFFGSVIKMILDAFDKRNEKRALDEGEVFEKETKEDEEDLAEVSQVKQSE